MCGQTPPLTSADLEGDLPDSSTGQTLPGVRLKLKTPDGEPVYSKTDKRGHFHLSDIAPGFYYLAARAPDSWNVPSPWT